MHTVNHRLNNPPYWLVPLAIWTQLVIASAWWSVYSAGQYGEQTAVQRGRDLFMMIELTREWNASHGGIYAVRSERATPNPHLQTPNRDLSTQQGLKLTMIDPAYMARQISELARQREFHFHITSTNPLRPANAPDAWERRALESFEGGVAERVELISAESGSEYRYMAPLEVKATCLGCHAHQGYQLGDIRGGISVNIDAGPILAAKNERVLRTVVTHALVWALVSAILWYITRNMRRSVTTLNAARQLQARTIAEQGRALKQAKEQLHNLQRKDALTGFYNRDYFEKALQEALDKAEARGAGYGLLIVELDYFKEFNDAYGILEGDIVIRMVADVFRQQATAEATLFGRYIGSSFAIGVAGADPRSIRELSDRICRGIYEMGVKHEHSAAAKFVTATIGVTCCQGSSAPGASTLLKKAALAMYKGKQKGRNCVIAA